MRSNTSVNCGPFDLLETIGHGGMAKVWRGVHRGQQAPVAVKVITGAKATDPEYVRRFEREVQAVAGLDHPGIVTVFDYGRISDLAAKSLPELTAGSPYLAMEFAQGGTLRQRDLITNWPTLRAFVLEMLDALAYAHAREVIHRDIKPENILCQIEGGQIHFKLSDFGIAHALEAGLDSDTQSYDGASAGTPHYMPPEQLTGDWRDFGPWSDLYALGCLIYELVSGRRPFEDSSFVRLANMHLNMPFPELEPRFVVPEALDAFVRKLVAKRPSQRFRRAADAAFAFGRLPDPDESTDVGMAPLPDDIDVNADTAASGEHLGELRQMAPDAAPTEFDPVPFGDLEALGRLETQTFATRQLATLTFDEAAELDVSERAEQHTVELAPVEFEPPPPLPKTWRAPSSDRTPDQLAGVGLGLFGLRAIPFVDRNHARDLIWQELREVCETRALRAISLRGGIGTGKSRLVEWIAQRAHEVGAATVLRAPHSQQGGPAEGIGRMLESFFAAWSLDRALVYERVHAKLAQLGRRDDSASGTTLDDLARGLTELMRPTPDDGADAEAGPQFHFSSPGERNVLVANFLERLAEERPVILWADDIPWGEDTLGLVEFLLAQRTQLPVLVMMTSRTDMYEGQADLADRVRRIDAHERVDTVDIDSLAPADHAELIRRILRLDDSLSKQVEERTGGNPLFAVQLIGDWVSRGILEVGREGFSLREGAVSALPRDIHGLWVQRVEKILEDFAPEKRWNLRISLELAATLGQHVDGDEWRAVCDQYGVEASEELVTHMIEHGMVRRGRAGGSFVHSMLPESLRQAAERAGRAPKHHLACVRALEMLYPDSVMKTARRRALHLIGARRFDEALGPLKQAVHYCADRGDYHTARELLERREALVDQLGLPQESRRQVENLWVRAQIEIPLGNPERSMECAERAAEIAHRHGWKVDEGHALVVKARLLRDQGAYSEALTVLDEAYAQLHAVDDAIGLLFTRFAQGFISIRLGKFAEARERFDEALAYSRRLGDSPREAEVLSHIGYAWFSEGAYARAEQVLAEALELATKLGSLISISSCSRHLGEIARFQGDWARARKHYTRSRDIEQARGARTVLLDRLNLALVDLADARYDRSKAAMDELRAAYADRGMCFGLPIIDVGLAAAAAGLGDRAGFDDAFERALGLLADSSGADKDIAWLAETAARLCAEAGWDERAAKAQKLADDIYAEIS